MMKYFFLFTSFVFTSLGYACEINLPEHLLFLGETSNISLLIKHQQCNENDLQEISLTLHQLDGRITAFQLTQIFKTKGLDVKISPELIQIQQFKQIVREQLMLPPGVQLFSSQALNNSNFLALSPGDKVEVQCIGCLYGTDQTLNLNIINFDGGRRSLTVKANFKKMVKAYRLTHFMPAFSDLSNEILKEDFVESIPHTDLVTDLDTLKFYKLNKPVKSGELLKQSDLNAIHLVKAGVKTEVIMESSQIRIKTHGVSRNAGTLGEFVEVFHPQKNKKYLGKVIDINKVLVEL